MYYIRLFTKHQVPYFLFYIYFIKRVNLDILTFKKKVYD